MSTVHHTLTPGTRIDCFEIGRVLGVGGFGITYQGYDHTLSCDVAIKEYLPSGVGLRAGDGVTVVPKSDQDQELYNYGLDRFLEEARILAKFKVPSIVRVARFLESNGTAYLIMDYEDGESLSAYLKVRGALPEDRLLSILRPLLQGLWHVHAKGYLHRDIKPGNIYLRKDGSPVLLDFGAARQSICSHSKAVTCMVTPGFAPFEQYNNSGKQGPWTDLYGLGATFYRCITNKDPVSASDRIMALHDGGQDPLIPARVVGNGRYSDPLLEAIDWMLQPSAADRPQSVEEVLTMLPGSELADVNTWPGAGERISQRNRDTRAEAISQPTLSPERMETVERELAAHIGPMARVMVKNAANRARDVAQLYAMLAESIPSESAREAFLKHSRKREAGPGVTPHGAWTRGATSPISGPSRATRLTESRPLTDEFVQRAERALAAQVGPLARVLVRMATGATRDADAFVELLEKEIDNDDKRRQFRQAMKG